jgi:pyruvate/2-oxoacid:ferredoxin oxidoreductase alpha subunit
VSRFRHFGLRAGEEKAGQSRGDRKMSHALSGRVFWSGNEIIAEAALRAGCTFFGGYPITPSSELAAHMALRLPQVGGAFIQMEDEIAAMGAIIGASLAGPSRDGDLRPGLAQAGEHRLHAKLCVIADVQRGGPSGCHGSRTGRHHAGSLNARRSR